jgi:hypothetical protein
MKADGSITAWGDSENGGANAPDGSGYIKIYSSGYAFAAMKADGSIKAWGESDFGGEHAPDGNGYTKIYSTKYAFSVGALGAFVPPASESPHAVIEPSVLRAAKASAFE